MKFSYTARTIVVAGCLLALAACQTTATAGNGESSSAVSTVIAKMATTSLAKTGQISGNFNAIGKESGTAFYKSKCT